MIQSANIWVRCSLYRGTCDSRKGNVEGRTYIHRPSASSKIFLLPPELLYNVLICSRRNKNPEIWFGVTSGVSQRRQRERLLVAVYNADWEMRLVTVPKVNGETFDSKNPRHDMLRYFRRADTFTDANARRLARR